MARIEMAPYGDLKGAVRDLLSAQQAVHDEIATAHEKYRVEEQKRYHELEAKNRIEKGIEYAKAIKDNLGKVS